MATISYSTQGRNVPNITFNFYDPTGAHVSSVVPTELPVGTFNGVVPTLPIGNCSVRIKSATNIIAVFQFNWDGASVSSLNTLLDSLTSNLVPNKMASGNATPASPEMYLSGTLPSGKNAAFITNAMGALLNERSVVMELSREIISQYGVEVYYIQNPFTNVDLLYGEDRFLELQAANTKAIVVYVKDAQEGYEGGAFFSKFGFQNKQNADFLVSRATWNEVFGTLRPMEGDLLYIPRWNAFGPTDFMRVTFVDKFDVSGFYPLGDHYTFTISTEKWAYSSEKMNTGVADIDAQEAQFSNDITVNPNLEAELTKVNDVVQTNADAVALWDVNNPFGRG